MENGPAAVHRRHPPDLIRYKCSEALPTIAAINTGTGIAATAACFTAAAAVFLLRVKNGTPDSLSFSQQTGIRSAGTHSIQAEQGSIA